MKDETTMSITWQAARTLRLCPGAQLSANFGVLPGWLQMAPCR